MVGQLTRMSHMNTAANNAVAPVTATHRVLVAMGHVLTIEGGCYCLAANPARVDHNGCISEADWAVADAAEVKAAKAARAARKAQVAADEAARLVRAARYARRNG